MKPTIKIIIANFYSKRDVNGNCYWMSRVTSTQSGRSLSFSTPHNSNTEGMVRRAGFDWNDIYSYNQEMSIRDFNAKNKLADHYNSCMDETLITLIGKLHRKERAVK